MKRAIWIGLLVCLMASPLFSQGIRDSVFRIEGVSVEAERIFLKEEAGMKQSRVDSTVLQTKAALSLSELLSENTSVFIKKHGRGALATASFRGTAASHTQVNWNGISLNSPMAGMVDFSLIPVYLIDELNLKHGPASLADGTGGIGGSGPDGTIREPSAICRVSDPTVPGMSFCSLVWGIRNSEARPGSTTTDPGTIIPS